jgi:glycerol-3-phosphate dehydrogenase
VHGGLRYLEQYAFRLVREALAEREVLLSIAPHLVWPMRFVLPHRPAMRPRWMIRAGLFLYDHLARRVSLPGAAAWDPTGGPLRPEITAAFAYSDCWVEDSRLVVLNAKDAARRGAEIRTRCTFMGAARDDAGWTVRLSDGVERTRMLVNAAGPWAIQALSGTGAAPPGRLRLVRGSHIVLPALYAGEHAFILQHDDGRVVFVIPYEGRFSLVGTTDVVQDSPGEADCTDEEAQYLCDAVARQFRVTPRVAEIVWRFAGVRPLFDDGAANPSAVTRDYVLSLDRAGAPLLSVFGGKITTYRRLAEEALATLAAPGTPWTATAPLPGGEFHGGLPALDAELAARFPWLDAPRRRRFARAYGSETAAMLGDSRRAEDLGAPLGAGLTERELDWLRREEWARSAEDVLWRRSKLGLHMTPAEREALAERLG